MEERQTQIKEGAGLDDSRLNKEFIEMLSKWGPYVFIGIAMIAGVYALYQYYERQQAAKRDSAFVSFNAAAVAQSPDLLGQVAQEHAAGTAVPLLSAQIAADIHLSAARSGIPVGERLGADGKLPEGKSFLTDEQRAAELAKAEELYKSALGKSNGSVGQEQFAISALTGLAAIAEDRGKSDEAANFYNQAIAKAEAIKFDDLAKKLKERVASLPALSSAPKLLTSAELPGANPVNPVVMPMSNFNATTTEGKTFEVPPPTFTAPDGSPIPSATPPADAPKPAEPKPAEPANPG